jgi:hypothetical protein
VVPPFAGTAVNVTLVPAQMAPDGFAEITTLTGNSGLTDMVMVFEVAGLPEGQMEFEVKTQVTVFPFVNDDEV